MITYRPDIDGLRAVAIVLVVLFHVGVPGFNGGFIGVDVFFVISGYLITALLLQEINDTGRINLIGFYGRRVRRLIPALTVVIVATLVLGYFFLTPFGAQQHLARSAIASMAFSANFFFHATTGGYFDGPTNQVPLLHLWSLAVEEQFYAIWPMLLLCAAFVAKRYQKRQWCVVLVLTATCAAASFMASLWLTQANPSAAYFYMPIRAWQLLAGAALALATARWRTAPPSWLANCLMLTGSALIAWAVLWIESSHPYPGVVALIPTLGAVVLILGGSNASTTITRWLTLKPIVAIGKFSYSWYLWHWPLLALARAHQLGEASLTRDAAIAGLSLGLAAVTYVAIEKSFQKVKLRKPFDNFRMLRGGAVVAVAVVGFAGALGLQAKHQRSSDFFYVQLYTAMRDVPALRHRCHHGQNFQELTPLDNCISGSGSEAPKLLLWGDSHADHYSPLLEQAPASFIHRSMSICPALFHADGLESVISPNCQAFNEAVLDEVVTLREEGLKAVVLSSFWTHIMSMSEEGVIPSGSFEAALQATVQILRTKGLRVLIMGPTPVLEWPAVECLARRSVESCSVSRLDYDKAKRAMETALRGVLQDDSVRLIMPGDILCEDGRCYPVRGNTVFFRDKDHLTAAGARQMAQAIQADLLWAIKTKAP